MGVFKVIVKILFFLFIFRVIFIDVETGCDKFEKSYGERDCDWAPGEGPESTWRWRLTGNEIKGFSFSSKKDYPERDGHPYTECSYFGGKLWIDGYTKENGTKVDGHYRKRPSCWGF